jgi:hypothetical protein
MLIIGLSF